MLVHGGLASFFSPSRRDVAHVLRALQTDTPFAVDTVFTLLTAGTVRAVRAQWEAGGVPADDDEATYMLNLVRGQGISYPKN